MDPQLRITDLPLAGAVAAAVPLSAAPIAEVGNTTHNQSPYAEMITAAIMALNERDGSSSRAIGKYIEQVYSNLPPGHSSLLTRHLKRMKNSGELVMVKHSYVLPGSTPPPVSTPGPKRKPGRPPKRKPDTQPRLVAQPQLWAPEGRANADIQTESVFVSVGLDGGPTVPSPPAAANVAPARRGRGRPKKLNSEGKSSGHPPKTENLNQNGGRRPGRPPKSGFVPGLSVAGRPRGRPKRIASSTGIGKLRGRPKTIAASIAKKLRRTGSRPAKNTLFAGDSTDGLLPTAASVAINVPIIDGDTRSEPFPGVGGVDNVGAPNAPIARVGAPNMPIAANGGLLPPKRRGRPPKLAGRAGASATNALLLTARRRGQLPRSGNVNGIRKPRKLTGKPLGRPRKIAALVAAQAPDSQQLAAFQDLQVKFENLKTRVKETASIIKPYLNSETMAALQELEALAR